MKKYEMPELELKVFALEDVIAISWEEWMCPQDEEEDVTPGG